MLSFVSSAQDVGISGGFFASTISVDDESELQVIFTNNSFDTAIDPFGAYVQLDFPTTGEYSAPANPPTGSGASNFNWSFTAPNIWIGLVNTSIPPLSSHEITFTVVGENITDNTPTILFTDLSFGSDNDPQNNNAQPLLAIQESLPVELLDFRAKLKGCDIVNLEWSTALEINNEGFEILLSEDGSHKYESLGFVKGAGNTTNIMDYSFEYNLPAEYQNRSVYFRLKQIDFDGKFTLSDLVKIDSQCEEKENLMFVGPNPTSGELFIRFNQPLEEGAFVRILDERSQLIKSYQIEAENRRYSIDMQDFPKGVYTIMCTANSIEYTKRIILID